MAKDIPFDDDAMTLIMGLGGPEEPGQHGRRMMPKPGSDIVDILTQIRDLCEDALKKYGKEDEDEPEEKEDKEDTETSDEDEEEE